MVDIQEIERRDLHELIRLLRQLDEETDYLLYEKGERPLSVSFWKKKLDEQKKRDEGTFLIAWHTDGDEKAQTRIMAGYLEIRYLPFRKVAHRAYVVIGVLSRFRGMGVGRALLECLDHWALKKGVKRLYLTVIAENKRAVTLYQKMGYQKEGSHPASMKIGGRYVEEWTMGKWLDGDRV